MKVILILILLCSSTLANPPAKQKTKIYVAFAATSCVKDATGREYHTLFCIGEKGEKILVCISKDLVQQMSDYDKGTQISCPK